MLWSEMSAGEMNTSLSGEETHSLNGNQAEDVKSAATGLRIPLTSEEVAQQIKAATDPLTKHLKKLCDLNRELRRDTAGVIKVSLPQLKGPQYHVAAGTTLLIVDKSFKVIKLSIAFKKIQYLEDNVSWNWKLNANHYKQLITAMNGLLPQIVLERTIDLDYDGVATEQHG